MARHSDTDLSQRARTIAPRAAHMLLQQTTHGIA
jgi:hypothetical protein